MMSTATAIRLRADRREHLAILCQHLLDDLGRRLLVESKVAGLMASVGGTATSNAQACGTNLTNKPRIVS
jgi:hypothetical protein